MTTNSCEVAGSNFIGGYVPHRTRTASGEHMNTHFGSDQSPGVRPGLRGIVAGAALVVSLASVPVFAGTAWAATGTVITTAPTAFGRALVVGSGPYAGFSLYFITSDHGRTFGCTSKPVVTPVGTLLCTGPSNDTNAEWPAITTDRHSNRRFRSVAAAARHGVASWRW